MYTVISLSYNSSLFQVSLSVATMGPLALLSSLGGVLGLMLGLGVLQILQLADSQIRGVWVYRRELLRGVANTLEGKV